MMLTSDGLAEVNDQPRIAKMPKVNNDLSAFLEAQMADIGGLVCHILTMQSQCEVNERRLTSIHGPCMMQDGAYATLTPALRAIEVIA
jgi:hypothetical protein